MRAGTIRARLALGAAVTTAALVMSGGPAAADPNVLTITGGRTSTVSAPEVGTALLRAGILPLPVGGASLEGVDLRPLTLTTGLPITGGSLDQSRLLAGDIRHRGGLKFVNLFRLRSVTVSDFVVKTETQELIATVDGRRTVQLFTLDLSALQLGGDGQTELQLNNVGLTLTQAGADALNGKLRSSVFKPGLKFGTGNTTVTFTRGT